MRVSGRKGYTVEDSIANVYDGWWAGDTDYPGIKGYGQTIEEAEADFRAKRELHKKG